MTKRGYTPAILAAHISSLQSLTGTAGDQDQAQGDAIEDTSVRDGAYEALKSYMKELKGVAKGALRGKHSLLSKLGF